MASTTPQSSLSFPRETFAKLSPHPYLLAHLQPSSETSKPTRANGRAPKQFRQPHVNNGSLTHAEGSAVVRIGDTTVVCGIRGEVAVKPKEVCCIIVLKRHHENHSLVYSACHKSKSTVGGESVSVIKNCLLSLAKLSCNRVARYIRNCKY